MRVTGKLASYAKNTALHHDFRLESITVSTIVANLRRSTMIGETHKFSSELTSFIYLTDGPLELSSQIDVRVGGAAGVCGSAIIRTAKSPWRSHAHLCRVVTAANLF